MFKEREFNENVDYCNYVDESNKSLGLDLSSDSEIQKVANMYVDELIEEGFDVDAEVVKNDLLLLDVVDEFKEMSKEDVYNPYDPGKDRKRINDKTFERIDKYMEEQEFVDNLHYKEKTAHEKELNSRGFYDKGNLNPDDENLSR